MDSLISRQEAITELSSLFWPDPYDACNKNYGHDEHNCAIAEAIDEIEGLPSAQPEPRWIPVTERLPEKDGVYIVCLDDRSVFEYDYISKWWDDGAWQYCGKDVVAWMPLPEPYKGDKE